MTTKAIHSKISHFKNKINELEKLESLLKETKSLNKHNLNKIEKLEKKIILLEEEDKENKELFLKYKEVCSKDITVLASAITELYNLMNIVFEGKLLQKNNFNNYKENLFDDTDFLDETEEFLFEEDITDKKKKKKIYH